MEEYNRTLYLDLMKRSLLNIPYGDTEALPFTRSDKSVWRWLGTALERRGVQLSWSGLMNPERRREGRDHPPTAHTMIGMKRLDNLEKCVRDVVESGVPGDLIETGVWRGGATIFMKAVLESYGVKDRRVFVADSFQGIPAPNPEDYPVDKGSRMHEIRHLSIGVDQVRRNFEAYGLLDDRVCFLEGWFRDTLPSAPIDRLAVLRLDGDLYESTMDALVNLYPKLSVGGYLIVDDYKIYNCRRAVTDYFEQNGIEDRLVRIDHTGVYCQRTA